MKMIAALDTGLRCHFKKLISSKTAFFIDSALSLRFIMDQSDCALVYSVVDSALHPDRLQEKYNALGKILFVLCPSNLANRSDDEKAGVLSNLLFSSTPCNTKNKSIEENYVLLGAMIADMKSTEIRRLVEGALDELLFQIKRDCERTDPVKLNVVLAETMEMVKRSAKDLFEKCDSLREKVEKMEKIAKFPEFNLHQLLISLKCILETVILALCRQHAISPGRNLKESLRTLSEVISLPSLRNCFFSLQNIIEQKQNSGGKIKESEVDQFLTALMFLREIFDKSKPLLLPSAQ